MNDILTHWEPVIGLEIHVQLNTHSKLFSSAANHFGDEPNSNISVVCTGQPGALPVLNREAVRKAVQFGLAIGGQINLVSRFDRKSYFYPDSPRNFQITQYTRPIISGGRLPVGEKTFAINRAHLEDDAGMLKHFSHFAGVDYNRAGAPLIEIVSEPCLHSGADAAAYARAMRALLLYLDVSDCNMDEGSLRIDVNISVRPRGSSELRPRVEIKNMNSFSFLEMAVDYELRRQVSLYLQNPHTPHLTLIPPGTRRFDPDKRETILMREKQSAEDYRYFPEPDLPPLVLTQSYLDSIAATLPELPHDRYLRYTQTLGLPPYDASLLIENKPLCTYFEAALATCPHPRTLCNWITVEFTGRLKDTSHTLPTLGIPPAHIAELVHLIETSQITGRIAKSIADDMVASPATSPSSLLASNPDYRPISDTATLEPLVDQVLRENPQSVADYKAGREKAFGFLVGQIMKLTRGTASPSTVNALLHKKLQQ